jgi:hypothetical protein
MSVSPAISPAASGNIDRMPLAASFRITGCTTWFSPSSKKWRLAWKLELIQHGNPQWRDLFNDLVA